MRSGTPGSAKMSRLAGTFETLLFDGQPTIYQVRLREGVLRVRVDSDSGATCHGLPHPQRDAWVIGFHSCMVQEVIRAHPGQDRRPWTSRYKPFLITNHYKASNGSHKVPMCWPFLF